LIHIQSPLSIILVLICGGAIAEIKNLRSRIFHLNFSLPFCLIVALDGDFVASGDLYVDDRMTF
jgi:hypothetical protein